VSTFSSSVAAIGLFLLSVAADGQERRRVPEQSRQRTPEGFACERNDLTVYTGVVSRYRRARGRTTLRIRTDWGTTENVTVTHQGTDDPSTSFRYMGNPFTAQDWVRLETSKGVLRPGMRAAAWVCGNGKVLVDWGVAKE
jgi:hypothetical protein